MKKATSVLLVLFCVSVAASDRPHLISQLRDGPITADGHFDDWYGNLEPLGKEPVSVQVLNDRDFLYLRFTASEAAIRREIIRQGFTVWFDPAGGTKKKFGIRYPVVEHGSGEGQGRGEARGRSHGDGQAEEEPEAAPSDRVDILGPGKDDARSLTREHLSGVDVAVRSEQGILQYELKVPLARSADHPYAIGTEPGKTIGLGLETGKMQQQSFGQGRGGGFGGGGMGGGGMGGRGGGGRGGGGGGRGGRGGEEGRGFQPPKPLKAWATVSIALAR